MKAMLTVMILLIGTAVFSQAPYLYFSRITSDNGLSHNKVNCILQDKRGFIWLGTEDGLNRYDGHYFTVFRNDPNDTSTISGNIITDLLEDETGIIWIATSDGGLTRYDYRLPAKKQFKQFKHIANDSTTIPVNIINKIAEDKYGYLWLATSGNYVLRFDKKKETFESPVHSGTRSVASLVIDKEGTLWAGKIGGSFLKLNTATLEYGMDKRYDNLYAKLPHATITALFRDKENNIWFGSWDNVLYCYNETTKTEKAFKQDSTPFSFPNDEAKGFAEDRNGRLWIAGRYYGLTIYDKQQKKFYNYPSNPAQEGSVADNTVNCVYIDRAGMVWLGTGKGVSVYNPLQQPFVQTFLPSATKNTSIYDFYEDDDNNLWIGTNEGVYIKENNGGFTFKKLSYEGEALAAGKFFKDQDGTFYIGTQRSLFVYDIQRNTVALLPNTAQDTVMKRIINSRVVSLMRDTIEGHPVLLVSPYGHYITYYDFVEKRWVSRGDSVKNIIARFNLKDNLIRKFYRTTNGHIWLATAKYGLGSWRSNLYPVVNFFVNNPKEKHSISNNNVYDILEDKQGNLWISTYGGGLNYFDVSKQNFTHVDASNNLLEGTQADDYGNVWMISNGNLNRYDPHSKSYTIYTLPDIDKTGGVNGYMYKDSKGNLYAAGLNYYIMFNPLLLKEVNDTPKVYFTDFKIFDDSYPELLQRSSIELRYFQNYFSIKFSAPVFTGNPVQYSYMLEGIDKSWINAGSHNQVNYSNLPHGEYILKVRASTKKGTWRNEVASLKIIIIPPFWQRWWFYLVCTIATASVVYFLYRYRINELLKRQAMRNKIAQDLHDNMGSTLSSISVYSQVAKIYYEQHKEDQLQQTLEKIGETSGEMIAEMSDIVWAINPRNDHISTILQRMESYAKPLLQAKGIHFNFIIDPAITSLDLPMDRRKNFYLIFKEAVNNAIKYSNAKTLIVQIHLQHQKLVMVIKDDGDGFDMQHIQTTVSRSLAGNGLKNMQMRAKEMKATFNIKSMKGEGTVISLSFPIP